MREPLKKEDSNFIDALEKINRIYIKNRDIDRVYIEIRESVNLPQRASSLLKNLFSVAHTESLTFSKKFIKSMTLDSARKFLISEQKKKKEKSMKSEKYSQHLSRIDVERDSNSNNIHITGSSLKSIENFLKYELSASWSDKMMAWVINDSNKEQNIDKIYENIVNKVTYNELRESKKEEYLKKANQQTLMAYGRSSILYTDVVNFNYLNSEIEKLETKQENGDKIVRQVYESLVATSNAYKELKEIGFLTEEDEEVQSGEGLLIAPIARFQSSDAKIALARNIDATKGELKTLFSSLTESREEETFSRREEINNS